jgi:hypothetical protein
MRAQPTGLLEVTVTVRYIPLVTAAYGTRVARPARTTMLAAGGDGSQLDRRVRPVLGEPLSRWARARKARGSWVETRTLPRFGIATRSGLGWRLDLRLLATVRDRSCRWIPPLPAPRVPTVYRWAPVLIPSRTPPGSVPPTRDWIGRSAHENSIKAGSLYWSYDGTYHNVQC